MSIATEHSVQTKYETWLNSEHIDPVDREELRSIKDDPKEIEERFYQDMAFGTGGLRGIRGMGTNRLNKYVIRKATQGLANYMLKNDEQAKSKGVVIAYDSRIMSPEFAMNTAQVMAANGIKAYLFDSLRTTPQLSFAVRELGALAGVVITASHNPPEYNGYKVYWEDGAQIVAPHDRGIIAQVNNIQDLAEVKMMEVEAAQAQGLIEMVGGEIDEKFTQAVVKQVVNPGAIKAVADDFHIVYTPLHGTGHLPVKHALLAAGFKHVHLVEEQKDPDGTFPTVDFPNPEEPEVFKLGIELAEKVGAKIVMANDPDADRIGVAVKTKAGDWMYPNGNQIGLLLSEYILAHTEEVPDNAAIVSTIVSTPMLDQLGERHKVAILRTLTGFKYIGEKIRQFEEGTLDHTFLFGFEESYGYLKGTHARDKDAVVSTLLIAELAAYYESKGSSIPEDLVNLYESYGYFREGLKAVKKAGKAGAEEIKAIMARFRDQAPEEMLGKKVVLRNDYLLQKRYDLQAGTESQLDLPASNVLQFVLEDNTYITMRPSGTEPKIKYYFGVKADTEQAVEAKLKDVMQGFLALVG